MKKRTAARGAFIIILAAACAFGFFSSLNQSSARGTERSHILPVYVTDLGDVSSFSIVEGKHRLTFTRTADSWQDAADPEKTIDQETVQELADLLSRLPAETMIQDPEDLSLYGLSDSPLSFEITTSESTAALLVGDEVDTPDTATVSDSTSGSDPSLSPQYYACLSGGTLVYTIDQQLLELTSSVLSSASVVSES